VAFSVDNAYFLRHQEARLILKEVGLHNGWSTTPSQYHLTRLLSNKVSEETLIM
jgi:hypothetical protein